MKNREIAAIFDEMADILEVKGELIFKVRAYRRASLNLLSLTKPVEVLSRGELLDIPGIGAELAAKIEEYCQSGKVHTHERLKSELPPGILELLAVPGLGPKTARLLVEKGGITDLDTLERSAREHRLAEIPGIQAKTEENILKGIAAMKKAAASSRQP